MPEIDDTMEVIKNVNFDDEKKKKKNVNIEDPVDEEDTNDETDSNDSDEEEDDDDEEEEEEDEPEGLTDVALYNVLGSFLMDEEGNSIGVSLSNIAKELGKLNHTLRKYTKSS
jgi:hypothetical protein